MHEKFNKVIERLGLNDPLVTRLCLLLSRSRINYSMRMILLNAIKFSTTLVDLKVVCTGDSVDDGGFVGLLLCNTKLKRFSCDTRLDIDAAVKVAQTLKTNQCLEGLRINFTEIGAEGAEAIAEAIKNNITLVAFEFPYTFDNCVYRRSLVILEKAVEKNYALTSCYEYVGETKRLPTEKVGEYIARNRQIILTNMAILIKARFDKTESQTLLRWLPQELLGLIIPKVHPKMTREVFERLNSNLFFCSKPALLPLEEKRGLNPTGPKCY